MCAVLPVVTFAAGVLVGVVCTGIVWLGTRRGLASHASKLNRQWVVEYRCVSCNRPLSIREMVCHIGVCPHCGHDSRGFFCDVHKIAWRVRNGSYEEWEQ